MVFMKQGQRAIEVSELFRSGIVKLKEIRNE